MDQQSMKVCWAKEREDLRIWATLGLRTLGLIVNNGQMALTEVIPNLLVHGPQELAQRDSELYVPHK